MGDKSSCYCLHGNICNSNNFGLANESTDGDYKMAVDGENGQQDQGLYQGSPRPDPAPKALPSDLRAHI